MSDNDYNILEPDASPCIAEDTYCIYLNIMEGLGFLLNDNDPEIGTEKVVLVKVSLNGVLFEVAGSITQQNSIIFNNNCIWECDLDDAKKIKSDNRPIRMDCFLKSCYSIEQIGTLLLPLRSVKIIHNLPKLQIKPTWHALHNLNFKWRNNRPQIYLILLIVKKTLINKLPTTRNPDKHKNSPLKDLSSKSYLSSTVSQTLNMLQSQNNIYVQLLEEFGQIQVGSDSYVDCDIFAVTITFKSIKNVATLFDITSKFSNVQNNSFIFQYDFLGSISNVEIVINNSDYYTINQKISLNFRSSLKSLRLYFQKIFYIPVYLYYSNQNVASYRFEISQLLPNDCYFDDETSEAWTKNGSFFLNNLNNASNIKALKSSIEFMITLELVTKNLKKTQSGFTSVRDQNNHFLPHSADTPRDITEFDKDNIDYAQAVTQYLQTEKSFSHKAKINCVLWRSSITRQTDICESDSSNVFLRNTRTVGVNTEHFNISENDKLLLQSEQDLDNWKQQVMKSFLSELANAKQLCFQEFLSRWEAQISQVETKILKCEKLNAQLEEVQTKQKSFFEINRKNMQIADNALKEIESKSINMLTAFEMKITELSFKAEENGKEINALQKRVNYLEKQLALFKQNFLPMDQLKDILNDMRLQTARFADIENIYKEKWANIEIKTNELKLKLTKDESRKLIDSKVELDFEEILIEKALDASSNDDI